MVHTECFAEAPGLKKSYSTPTSKRSARYSCVGGDAQTMSEDRLREEALAVLQKAKTEDFDGHTEFYRMTPLERLRWLDQAVEMVLKLRPQSRQNTDG